MRFPKRGDDRTNRASREATTFADHDGRGLHAASFAGRSARFRRCVSWSGRVAQRDGHGGRFGRPSAGDQLAGELGEGRQAHENDEFPDVADFVPIDGVDGVAGHESDGGGVLAMGEGDAGVGGDAERGGDSGDDLESDAGIGEGLGLFAAAAEDEGVAALEADDGQSTAGALDQHAADFILGEFVGGLLFADIDAFGARRGEFEESGRGEVVVEDGVGESENATAFDGDQLGVAGACADQIDLRHGRSWWRGQGHRMVGGAIIAPRRQDRQAGNAGTAGPLNGPIDGVEDLAGALERSAAEALADGSGLSAEPSDSADDFGAVGGGDYAEEFDAAEGDGGVGSDGDLAAAAEGR